MVLLGLCFAGTLITTHSTRDDSHLILPLWIVNANSLSVPWNNFQNHISVFKPNGFFLHHILLYLSPGRVPASFTFSINTSVCFFPNPCGFRVAVWFFFFPCQFDEFCLSFSTILRHKSKLEREMTMDYYRSKSNPPFCNQHRQSWQHNVRRAGGAESSPYPVLFFLSCISNVPYFS